ncbi:alpha/beta hydrolase family protein [Caulobacter endophyticus]|uniref:alpha/beta hydrolase family protein n=1 Tax=Caulobacter endophyticus TaxID=2172652 RepID=UPI00240EB3A7|nr:prolyl oligopeptidase family serine peptidase [Caulobacter endophyticus]MDG2527621.1 prolyl oligopeptidase family serine peptidase [Caulobacter endophyticus]
MISDVVLSPDGKHIAALTSSDGVKVNISVWRTDALDQPPTIIGSTAMTFKSVEFVKNDRLRVMAMQTLTIGAIPETGFDAYYGHISKTYITDLEGKSWINPLGTTGVAKSEADQVVRALENAEVIDDLPKDPKNVLVLDRRKGREGDIYKVNIYTNTPSRIDHTDYFRYDGLITNAKGEIRGRTELGYDGGKAYFVQQIKNPTTGAWEDHFRSYARDRNFNNLLGFSNDPNIAYVSMVVNNGKRGVYVYDIAAKKVVEPLFEHKLFDAGNVILSNDGELLGVGYNDARGAIYWVNEKIGARFKAARTALGVKTEAVSWTDPDTELKTRFNTSSDFDVSIVDWSRDGEVVIVERSGPKLPPEYYLLDKTGKLTLLGSSRPWVKTDSLGQTKLVQYIARDGLPIPAFLTTPPASFGPGPHPTIIHPHGGPWSRDQLDWDPAGWVQYFASRGYVVLQPQFRGSMGWGEKLWRAGDKEWGGKMQDDKDDGAKWLIDQKLADPTRIAMFGYSYGGYAALAATIRPNGIYRCAVSGAGGSLSEMKKATGNSRILRERQKPSVDGLDAIQNAGEAKIPIFLYHGDRDENVDIKDSLRFINGLKNAGKPYKWMEIKDMGHGYITMTPDMMEVQLTEIERFFQKQCQFGGAVIADE